MPEHNRSVSFSPSEQIMLGIALLLSIPAFLINLGLLPLISDEAIRGTVALEMIYSDNFITPTMYGDLYFKKPPLFNWIIIGFFKLFGSNSDFVLRLPTIAALLLFGGSVFWFIRSQLGNRVAWMSTLAMLSCGRILFYDSMLALIDLWFSWIVFMNFMLIYMLHKKQKLGMLFLFSYFLTAVAFLFKGLPALAFQAITLLSLFLSQREFRKLLSLQHFAGIALFFLVLAAYYSIYLKQLQGNESLLFSTLFSESSSRTAIKYGWLKTITHLFSFPFEVIYHFAPWTLLAVVLFRKGNWKMIKASSFLHYSVLIVVANISIYWVSVEVYPRYLFMFLPLIFALIFYFVFELPADSRYRRIIDLVILTLAIITALVFALIPVSGMLHHVECLPLKSLVPAFAAALLAVFMFLHPKIRLTGLVVLLMIVRTGFNFIIVEERAATSHSSQVRDHAIEMGRLVKQKETYIFGTTPLDYISGFYITRENGRTLKRKRDGYSYDELYIIDPSRLERKKHVLFYSYVQWWEKRNIMLIQLKKPAPVKQEVP